MSIFTMDDFLDIKNNPIFWSNNKRKYHHLPLLHHRKKQRKNFYLKNRIAIFNAIEERIEEEISKQDFCRNFVDIKYLALGDKEAFYL